MDTNTYVVELEVAKSSSGFGAEQRLFHVEADDAEGAVQTAKRLADMCSGYIWITKVCSVRKLNGHGGSSSINIGWDGTVSSTTGREQQRPLSERLAEAQKLLERVGIKSATELPRIVRLQQANEERERAERMKAELTVAGVGLGIVAVVAIFQSLFSDKKVKVAA